MAKTPWDYSRHMGKHGKPTGVKQGTAVGAYIHVHVCKQYATVLHVYCMSKMLHSIVGFWLLHV